MVRTFSESLALRKRLIAVLILDKPCPVAMLTAFETSPGFCQSFEAGLAAPMRKFDPNNIAQKRALMIDGHGFLCGSSRIEFLRRSG
jgi:hypothetical protein